MRAGESRVTLVAGKQDNEIRQCRDWLEQNPDPAGGRVPQSQGRVPTLPFVSFLITKSQDEEITSVFPVLPESDRWWLNIPILVLGLDQGSIGLAGMAFAMRDNMVHVKCDKIHRAIRGFQKQHVQMFERIVPESAASLLLHICLELQTIRVRWLFQPEEGNAGKVY